MQKQRLLSRLSIKAPMSVSAALHLSWTTTINNIHICLKFFQNPAVAAYIILLSVHIISDPT